MEKGCVCFSYAVGFSLMLGTFYASRAGMVLEFMLRLLYLCWRCEFLCCCVESSPPWLLLIMLRVFV